MKTMRRGSGRGGGGGGGRGGAEGMEGGGGGGLQTTEELDLQLVVGGRVLR